MTYWYVDVAKPLFGSCLKYGNDTQKKKHNSTTYIHHSYSDNYNLLDLRHTTVVKTNQQSFCP